MMSELGRRSLEDVRGASREGAAVVGAAARSGTAGTGSGSASGNGNRSPAIGCSSARVRMQIRTSHCIFFCLYIRNISLTR